jgi:hypothetical protein
VPTQSSRPRIPLGPYSGRWDSPRIPMAAG